MPFIERQDKTKLEPLALRIRPEVIAELELYAAFLDDSEASWVVQEALRKVFAQDKEFQQWKKERAAEPPLRAAKGGKTATVPGDGKTAAA
jgi:hypothetical protein